MKTIAVLALVVVALLSFGQAEAQMFQTVSAEDAQLMQVGPGKLYCPNCGMNLVKFYKTSHAVKHETDSSSNPTNHYCSMHCLVEANEQLPENTLVVDTNSLKFIDAGKAFYVVGSSVKGTMSKTSKYAFASKSEAKTFVAKNGGEIKTFEQAAAIARKALTMENKMIGQKRAKVAKKGQAIFSRMAGEIELPKFDSIADAKTYVVEKGICGKLKDDQYQAVAIYLFANNTPAETAVKLADIKPARSAKCPVCGMFVSSFPKWIAQVDAKDGHKYYFDGVKDMMKFYFDPAKYHVELTKADFSGIFVTDYYTVGVLDATTAWYVAGSNVFGPMGDELIPFKTKKDALTFKEDHVGKQVLSFAEITESLVHGLDQ